MEPRVFISHSSKDKAIAEVICDQLESAGIKCWIAPRDIEVGSDWTKGIMQGVAGCRVFLLVFTAHANDSEHVGREVAKAFSLGSAVIPFRIDTVNPRENLGYFLETVQWFDATSPPWQRHLQVLTEHVKRLLAADGSRTPNAGLSDDVSSEALAKGEASRSLATGRSRRTTTRRRIVGIGLLAVAVVIATAAWLFFVANRNTQLTASSIDTQKTVSSASVPEIPAKSIAVLPFESLSASKDDTYFADGVQDEILNNLAKIAQLTVISRTSVMQYRADQKRDLRQVANALGVANVLEGTVRRNGNRVRVSTELIDARQDKTTWADSFDRDLTDIFAIQSEVAQTIATKLAATLSPEEKQNIEKKPTENLEAYDLYLRARELLVNAHVSMTYGSVEKPVLDAIGFLEQAVRLDPKFTLAYCASAQANDFLYFLYNPTPERRALADAAVNRALGLQPDLPEVHLAYAYHLYRGQDYERARVQLAIARRGLPNDARAIWYEALIDRRQGRFEKAIQEFSDAIIRDPHNPIFIEDLAVTLCYTRQFRAAEQVFDRLIELSPEQPKQKVGKAVLVTFYKTGDDSAVRSAIAALPASMADDPGALSWRLAFALVDRDWSQAKELIEKMKGGDDEGDFAYGLIPVPVGCYSILLARLQREQPGANAGFAETREQLNQKVQKAQGDAKLLSQLAVVDALLNNREVAISEATHAVELLPISKDALSGPFMEMNLVYAWTNELDLAFEKLDSLIKVPSGVFYGQLKRDPYWEPLRQDPRYEKLLAELALRDGATANSQ
jgi:TolB-like protein/Tfp pilus assembly protein PilF